MFLVLGIDAATWEVIKPNIDSLPTFKKLCSMGQCSTLVLKETPISPSVWCGMFCGRTPDEHKHDSFVKDGNIVKRDDIKVDFIWDILHRQGQDVRVLNVPFIVPPYSFNVDFKPIGFGLPTDAKEWQQELDAITLKTEEIIKESPGLAIAIYTLLDRVQHFHWGEDIVLEWYKKLDAKMGRLLFDSGFLEDKNNRLIVISDHGFCSFGEARVQTLPQKTEQGELKGDHHENAILVTVNVDYQIDRPQDVFYALQQQLTAT
ncbi:alkaline phosphatase family protein [Chloroflexota bacterium]